MTKHFFQQRVKKKKCSRSKCRTSSGPERARVSASHLLPTAFGARAAPNCSVGTRPLRLCQQQRPKHPAPSPARRGGSRDGGEKVGERLAGAPPPAWRAPGAQILFHPPRLQRPSAAFGRASPALPPRRQRAERGASSEGRGLRAQPRGQLRTPCARPTTSHTRNAAPHPREPGARPEGARRDAQGKLN